MNRYAIPTALFVFENMSCYQHIIATRLITDVRNDLPA